LEVLGWEGWTVKPHEILGWVTRGWCALHGHGHCPFVDDWAIFGGDGFGSASLDLNYRGELEYGCDCFGTRGRWSDGCRCTTGRSATSTGR
jgi:hypothetical protein